MGRTIVADMDRSVRPGEAPCDPWKQILGTGMAGGIRMSKKAQPPSTTGSGAPAPSDRNSLTVGPDGPILLHDVHLVEQLAHFNREKVIERQPHAKGAGAFGVFEATEDVSRYTKASLFQP